MLAAFLGAVVGAVLTVLFTRWFLPDSNQEIASLRKEVTELKQQLHDSENTKLQQKRDDEMWAEKFERAAKQVVKIGPSLLVTVPGSQTPLFGLVFPDNEMRGRILTFIVDKDARYTTFSMRSWSDEQLRRPTIRSVIEETLDRLGKFKTEYPQFSHYLA